MQHSVCVFEGQRDFGSRPGYRRRIGHAPMCGDGLTGPHWACFGRGIVADRKDEIEARRAWLGELIPRFRAKCGGIVAETAQEPKRFRMHATLGMAARTVGAKPLSTGFVQDRFGEDRACRIAGTEKENAVWSLPAHEDGTVAGVPA